MAAAKGSRQLRNIEKRKKKAGSILARRPKTRNTGVTSGARKSAKKAAGLARARQATA